MHVYTTKNLGSPYDHENTSTIVKVSPLAATKQSFYPVNHFLGTCMPRRGLKSVLESAPSAGNIPDPTEESMGTQHLPQTFICYVRHSQLSFISVVYTRYPLMVCCAIYTVG